MTEAQLSHFRDKLESRKSVLFREEQEIEREARTETSPEQTGEISAYPSHLADLGSQEFDRDVEFELAAREAREIQEVEEALRRIQDHTYGICQNCGKEISEGRLEAAPEARYCMACAGN